MRLFFTVLEIAYFSNAQFLYCTVDCEGDYETWIGNDVEWSYRGVFYWHFPRSKWIKPWTTYQSIRHRSKTNPGTQRWRRLLNTEPRRVASYKAAYWHMRQDRPAGTITVIHSSVSTFDLLAWFWVRTSVIFKDQAATCFTEVPLGSNWPHFTHLLFSSLTAACFSRCKVQCLPVYFLLSQYLIFVYFLRCTLLHFFTFLSSSSYSICFILHYTIPWRSKKTKRDWIRMGHFSFRSVLMILTYWVRT